MTQTGSDLVSAGLPTSNPWTALLGGSTNISQPNVPARSNLEWFGLQAWTATTFPAATGVVCVVACPVTPGLVVTSVQMLMNGTAASSPTHSWAAIYAGTGSAPALLAQTTDAGSTAIGANAWYSWTFGTPLTLSSATTNCPNGFVYVAASITATTQPTVSCGVGPATAAYYTPVLTTTASTVMPLFIGATFSTAAGGTAPATITSTTNILTVPIVVLR